MYHWSSSPHFDVFYGLLLNRRTATWNLFVLYNNNKNYYRQSFLFKSEFTRGPGRGDTCHLSNFDETLPDWRDYRTTLKGKGPALRFFPWELDHPSWFLAPNPKYCIKISIKFRPGSWLQNTMNFIAISYKKKDWNCLSIQHEFQVIWSDRCQSRIVIAYLCHARWSNEAN